jgi:hypothetical protein
MSIIIYARRREYAEEEWRNVIRVNFSQPLPSGRTQAEEVALILDAQEVMPKSAIEARRIAEDELSKRA